MDVGCVILLMATAVGIVIGLAADRRSRQATLRERIARAQRIVILLRAMATARSQDAWAAELLRELQGEPIGFVEPLAGEGGWFEQSAPSLTELLYARPELVEWYFSCFSFPAGRQRELLSWLAKRLSDKRLDADVLGRIVTRTLSSGGSDETEWIYRRALEQLPMRANDVGYKTFVLKLGRTSYAFRRPGKQPTIYDEQAVANDIANAI